MSTIPLYDFNFDLQLSSLPPSTPTFDFTFTFAFDFDFDFTFDFDYNSLLSSLYPIALRVDANTALC